MADRSPAELAAPPATPRQHALLDQLWQMSDYGWMTKAAIRRGLTDDRDQSRDPAEHPGERLLGLLECAWVEQRDSHRGPGESEWRLTDRGRGA